jgi:hypothetical protein
MAGSRVGYIQPALPTAWLATEEQNESGVDVHYQKVIVFSPGTWDYRAGVSGTVNVPAGARLLSFTCVAGSGGAGSVSINGGNSIPVPAGSPFSLAPDAEVIAPTIVFTGTDSYVVQFVT